MKYKVGDKVKAKGDAWFNEGEIIEIIKVDKDNPMLPYRCKGKTAESWMFDAELEPLGTPLAFQQKLDRFKREPIGFLVKSKEIADEIAKVFTKEGMVGEMGSSADDIMYSCLNDNGDSSTPWVSYNYTDGARGLSYGLSDRSGKNLREILDITLEELKSYNASTLEDKLALFKAGTHVLHTPTQEIYDKLMVELEKRGYVWASGDNPTEFNAYSGNESCVGYDNRLRGSCGIHLGLLEWCKEAGMEVLTLTPEDFSTPQVITITSDGYHRTTAESNGITAEALCNPTDKFSIHKGSHMALKRLLEKLEEDIIEELGDLSGEPEGFHAGDIVEIIGNEWNFQGNPIGLQGIVAQPNEGTGGADVKLPNSDELLYFYARELKLVRKYNA